MARRLLMILSFTGVLLSASLWGLSYWRWFLCTSPEAGLVYFVNLHPCVLYFDRADARHVPGLRKLNTNLYYGFRGWETTWWPDGSLAYWASSSEPGARNRGFRLPLWMPLAISLVYPLWHLTPWHRRRIRRKHNQCVACGYSLTGNTSGVCPECGTAPAFSANRTG